MRRRESGADIIRTIAVACVFVTHMFNYTGILNYNILSVKWVFLVFLKFVAITSVPLFLLLTGYLQSSRQFDAKHYSSAIPVLLSYFFISALNGIAEAVIFDRCFEPVSFIVDVLDCSYGYGWYVEMYIGIFLLIPFFNILFGVLSKVKKYCLIVILAFLTFCPAFIQCFTVGNVYLNILPDFFENLYGITYYFIGMLIAEYRPRVKRWICVVIGLSTLFFETVLCYRFSGEGYAWWIFNNIDSVTHAVIAVCVFLSIYDLNLQSGFLSSVSKRIAVCSFEMYLLSYITDMFCYMYLSLNMGIILLIDFAAALMGAMILRFLLVPLSRIIKRLFLKI